MNRLFYFLFYLLLLSGCASSPKYDLAYNYSDDDIYRGEGNKSSTIQISKFSESISDKEKPKKSGRCYFDYSDIKEPVINTIVDSLKAHLNELKMVGEVVYGEDEVKSPPDIFLELNIGEFYAYQECTTQRVSVLFGVVGVMLESVVNPKSYGGKVAYTDIRLLNRQGQTLWKGDIEFTLEGKEVMYKGSFGYARLVLKGANDKLARIVAKYSQK